MSEAGAAKYILVVDDDPTMQVILQGMVEATGNKPVIAETGEKALQLLEVGAKNIDVVLLDRHLPDMDGLEVVQAIEKNDDLTGLPVIMQSGSTEPDKIKEAIQAGVYYYLTKPFPMEALQSVFELALGRSVLSKALSQQLERGYTPVNLTRSAAFTMKTIQDAKNLSVFLSTLFPNAQRIFPGLLAIMLNAIEHGNLEVGYESKAALLMRAQYSDELKKRENMEQNLGKEVEVQFVHKDGRRSVRITDQGGGFDWKAFTAFKTERKNFVNGYGILKALNNFDDVKYNTAGNQVTVSLFEQ